MDLVLGQGPIPCPVMVIGEAPGKQEQEQGVPFIGAAGQILNKALEEARLSRDSVYVTNIYKLRPPENRTPTDDEVLYHAPHLVKEFLDVKPSFILLLGNTALKAITGEAGISQRHGTRLTRLGTYKMKWETLPFVYCTYHPAATIYNKSTREDFFRDVKTFGKIVQGKYNLPGLG